MLSFINSYITSHLTTGSTSGPPPTHLTHASATSAGTAISASTGNSGGDGSGAGTPRAFPLPVEVQQWEVQWSDLEIVRPIGGGSYGIVSSLALSLAVLLWPMA